MHFISMLVHDIRSIRISTFFSANLRSRTAGVYGKVISDKREKARKTYVKGIVFLWKDSKFLLY